MKTDKRSPKRTPTASRTGRVAGRRPRGDERTRKRSALRRDATDVYRRAILDAAERVFGGGSVADAKMAAIAREAGLASGTLYNYFDSKEEIFVSLIEDRGQELLRDLDEVAGRGLQPQARLGATVAACLGYLERHRDMMLVFAQTPFMELSLQGGAAQAAERVHRRCMRHFEDAVGWASESSLLRRDLQPAELAIFLSGVIHGFVREWLVGDRGRGSLVPKAATIVDLFMSGAGAAR